MSLTLACVLSAGCAGWKGIAPPASGRPAFSGRVHGGQQPISGAQVQLYAVSTAGDGAASVPLLSEPVSTDSAGNFSITSFSCPSGNPLVYITTAGGNPGLATGVDNDAATLIAVLGPCQAVLTMSTVSVNELTTVASIWPLASFMSSYKSMGSTAAESEQLANGFALANQMVDMSAGTSPGPSLPQGASVPTELLNTLADVIAACVNSPGGKSGDGTPCGNLFDSAKSPAGVSASNTADALIDLATSVSGGAGLFGLVQPDPPFGPTLSAAPLSWSLEVIWQAPTTGGNFQLNGLVSPATVAQSVFAMSSTLPTGSTVQYFLDDQLASTETSAPYWMGGQASSTPYGFSLRSVAAGPHVLRAVATLPDGSISSSSLVTLNVVPSPNGAFSSGLQPYLDQQSAQKNSVATALGYVTTPGAALSAAELAIRQQVLAMYMNWGIDPSLDYASDQSTVLAGLMPTGWAAPTSSVQGLPFSMLFSPDAPYYHAIPAAWPRVQLPAGYINNFQLNTTIDGDGIGFGEVSAASTDPTLPVRSEWYTDASTLKVFPFRMPANWSASLPWLTSGDSHMIFVDTAAKSFVSSYKTTADASSGGPDALYASSPTPLGTLGVTGGSNAAGFADLPVMIQPGEATNPSQPIPHAVGGPVGRTWAARVFPASDRDAGMLTSTNSCTGSGYTNTGLVPYGGLIQLDPSLDLTKLKLTLPALRILQAMQTYGYYVMDFGCTDLDIYTSITEKELDPYGGLWGNTNGIGVQNEIQQVLLANKLYVVAPIIKKQ